MEQCEICGNTVAHVNEAEVCNSCANTTFKTTNVKVEKDVEDKDNQDYMLKFFGITLEQFESVTHDNLSEIVESEWVSWYKNDAKRVLWHHYRAKALTKSGNIRKNLKIA